MNYRSHPFPAVGRDPAATFHDSHRFVKSKHRGGGRTFPMSGWLVAMACLWFSIALTSTAAEIAAPNTTDDGKQPIWTSLFDGRSLGDWKPVNFGGEGDVSVQDGRIVLDFGDSLTGIAYAQAFPKQDYEIRLEAMRLDGVDFFCGLTFPVGDSYCSLIVGGWGGALVGLSSIDGRDASENETTQYQKFERGKWYRIRVCVTENRIRCWIDEQMVIDQDIRSRRISTRSEVDLSRPLGIAAWQTRSALRGIEYRRRGEAAR